MKRIAHLIPALGPGGIESMLVRLVRPLDPSRFSRLSSRSPTAARRAAEIERSGPNGFDLVFVAEAAYPRAHKREPFTCLTLLMAVLTVGGSLLAVGRFGATGVTLVFLIVVTVVGLGGGTTTFLRARQA